MTPPELMFLYWTTAGVYPDDGELSRFSSPQPQQ